jgi:hypothetical protein
MPVSSGGSDGSRRRLGSWWQGLSSTDKFLLTTPPLLFGAAVALIAWGLDFSPRDTMLAAVGLCLAVLVITYPARFRRLPDGIAAIVGLLVLVASPSSTTQRDFYATAAQVVPVLFLALGFQFRAFTLSRPSFEANPFGLVSPGQLPALPALALFLAGFESLHALT